MRQFSRFIRRQLAGFAKGQNRTGAVSATILEAIQLLASLGDADVKAAHLAVANVEVRSIRLDCGDRARRQFRGVAARHLCLLLDIPPLPVVPLWCRCGALWCRNGAYLCASESASNIKLCMFFSMIQRLCGAPRSVAYSKCQTTNLRVGRSNRSGRAILFNHLRRFSAPAILAVVL
ncbi:hypothetical protein D3C86_1691630 [compost metagenome]